jgi:GT2 family glycosyltransferase
MSKDDRPLAAREVMAVVVTHNGAAWIQDCLRSLADSRHPVTAIVVDNGSTDDTLALVDAFPDVICLPQNTNLGFGRANNVGLGVALDRKAGWVLLLNQDARVEAEAVGELVRVSVARPRFGILSPFHLDGKGVSLDAGFANCAYLAGPELLSDLYLDRRQEVYPTTFVNAAAWLLTRECLDTVGGFDPLFFMWGEDNDYCNRTIWHGFEIGLVPRARIFHDRPGDRFSQDGQAVRPTPMVAWKFSNMLQDLKRPQGAFVQRIGAWGMTYMRVGLALIATGQLKGFLGLTAAMLKVVAQLPAIWRHRKTSREPGRHWI